MGHINVVADQAPPVFLPPHSSFKFYRLAEHFSTGGNSGLSVPEEDAKTTAKKEAARLNRLPDFDSAFSTGTRE